MSFILTPARQASSAGAWLYTKHYSRALKRGDHQAPALLSSDDFTTILTGDDESITKLKIRKIPSRSIDYLPSSTLTRHGEVEDVTRQTPVTDTSATSPDYPTPVLRDIIRRQRRSYSNNGKRLVPQTQKLAINILGQPGEALVLTEAPPPKRRTSPLPFAQTIEMPASSLPSDVGRLLDAQEAEGDEPTPEQIWHNIDSLTPTQAVVSFQEFKEVLSILYKGFTTSQLNSYIRQRQSQPMEVLDKTQPDPEQGQQRSWKLNNAQWSPATEGAVVPLEFPLQGYILESMPPKERLCVRILRECWDVSIQEFIDGPGRVVIRMRDLEFTLLCSGEQRYLRHLIKLYLKSGKMELIKSKKILVIHSTKINAEVIVEKLDQVLQKVGQKVSLQTADGKVDSALLAELGKELDAAIDQDRSLIW